MKYTFSALRDEINGIIIHDKNFKRDFFTIDVIHDSALFHTIDGIA